MSFKSGFISIVGRPNVGKSTLLNSLVGQKIAIMTDKAQTTRNTIRAIYNDDEAQMIFLDTPGIHKPRHALGEYMVTAAKRSLDQVELVLFMVDDSLTVGAGDKYICELLKDVKSKVIVLINKRDLILPDDFKKLYDYYEQLDFVSEVIGISALTGGGIDDLRQTIKDYLPEGPRYFNPDDYTDQMERQLASELIREKLLLYLEDEIPHGVAVLIDSFKERKNKNLIDIEATIVCEQDRHKGMIIGKGGKKIKGVGMAARKDIEAMLASKVNLQLFVKVRKSWRSDSNKVREYGYNLKDL